MDAFVRVLPGPAPPPDPLDHDPAEVAVLRQVIARQLHVEEFVGTHQPGRPNFDVQYQQALASWVQGLLTVPDALPLRERPKWWRPGNDVPFEDVPPGAPLPADLLEQALEAELGQEPGELEEGEGTEEDAGEEPVEPARKSKRTT